MIGGSGNDALIVAGWDDNHLVRRQRQRHPVLLQADTSITLVAGAGNDPI